MPVFFDYSQTNRTVENGLFDTQGLGSPIFLRSRSEQSDFQNPWRRMTSDDKPEDSMMAA